MAEKPVTSRAVKVDITITERREGAYSQDNVASTSIVIPLPASSIEIGNATDEAITALVRNAERFRGVVVAAVDVTDTAGIEV
jgi:hypothetical protein